MDTARASITFMVRVHSDAGGRVSGIVERVKTGEKRRFHDAEAIGLLIAEMVRDGTEATGPSRDAPMTPTRSTGPTGPEGQACGIVSTS